MCFRRRATQYLLRSLSDGEGNEDVLQLAEERSHKFNKVRETDVDDWAAHVLRHKGVFSDVIERRLLGKDQRELQCTG